jgi:anti-anti-sigma factor
MKIDRSTKDGVTILALDDRFDAHEVPRLRAAMEKSYGPGASIRLDLGAVRFLDSTALAELLKARGILTEAGGSLILQPVSDTVRVILELTGLAEVFGVAAPAGQSGRP